LTSDKLRYHEIDWSRPRKRKRPNCTNYDPATSADDSEREPLCDFSRDRTDFFRALGYSSLCSGERDFYASSFNGGQSSILEQWNVTVETMHDFFQWMEHPAMLVNPSLCRFLLMLKSSFEAKMKLIEMMTSGDPDRYAERFYTLKSRLSTLKLRGRKVCCYLNASDY
jgi:hypothetical protein